MIGAGQVLAWCVLTMIVFLLTFGRGWSTGTYTASAIGFFLTGWLLVVLLALCAAALGF